MINNKTILDYMRSQNYCVTKIIRFYYIQGGQIIIVNFNGNSNDVMHGIDLSIKDIEDYISKQRDQLINQLLDD